VIQRTTVIRRAGAEIWTRRRADRGSISPTSTIWAAETGRRHPIGRQAMRPGQEPGIREGGGEARGGEEYHSDNTNDAGTADQCRKRQRKKIHREQDQLLLATKMKKKSICIAARKLRACGNPSSDTMLDKQQLVLSGGKSHNI
jgi:hypothetical protein